MAQITYADKAKINDDPSLPAVNKVRDIDMNEIKEVVNENYTEFNNSIPVVLFNDANGVSGNVTLSDSASNYSYLEIFFEKDNYGSSIRVYDNKASLIAHYTNASSNTTYISFKNVSISGTTIIVDSYQEWYNNWGTSGVTAGNTNGILITKVLGYK